ncbi:MAG: LON peptidase substrate-binding domain-containing protein [Mariniblastus sp.]
MSLNQADLSLPDGFANIVRLFPLPNTVLFPGVVQALHLFEPRYRAMMDDALAADELITMAYLKPDVGFGEEPEISKIVCVGKILSHTLLDDGRYNVFLVGTKRAAIVKELPIETPYRMAEVFILDDVVAKDSNIAQLRADIVDAFRKLATLRSDWNQEAMDQFVDEDLSFGQLVDMICYASGASPADQQLVLETTELSQRGEIVLQLLNIEIQTREEEPSQKQDFPPGFSLN